MRPGDLRIADDVVRDGATYLARVTHDGAPATIVTSAVSIAWTDGEVADLVVSRGLASFLAGVEAAVADLVAARRERWFPAVSEPDLRAGLKSMLSGDDTVRVALDEAAVAFDASGAVVGEPADLDPTTRVKAVLRLDGARFGRTQFGAMWTVVQCRAVAADPSAAAAECLVSPDPAAAFD